MFIVKRGRVSSEPHGPAMGHKTYAISRI